jgi:site-specific recombinase XerD
MTLTLHGAVIAPDGQSFTGPLASHVEAFAAQLLHQGYAQSTVRAKCALLADLSRWLERRGLPLAGLDEGRLARFLATRRRRSKTRRGDRATGRQLLGHLRELEEIAAALQRIDRTPVACLTREFEEFLHAERGLASSTVSDYTHTARDFLEDRFGGHALHLKRLRSQDLHGFVLREVQRVSRSHGKGAGARLGLRGGEVVAMTLEDLDWERSEIVVRGKGQRLERLPLPAEVGAALACYLRDVRPARATRRVFIRMKAPLQGLARSAICCIVRRALRRAGLNPEFKGAHLLRHSLATDLLRRGASLGEIGQLLRHRQPTTTQIYAKVDIAALRGIAQPWPRGAS